MQKTLALMVVIMLLLSACSAENAGPSRGDGDSPGSPSAEHAGPREDEEPDVFSSGDPGVIRAVAGRNCNYVFHMMAVSRCGYDSGYGDRYAPLHAEADLQLLKTYEHLLTVMGGEYQGDLNFLFMILPASLDDDMPVSLYFEALADLFGTGEIERNFAAYEGVYVLAFSSVTEVSLDSFYEFYSYNEPHKTQIADIAAVMHRNYALFLDAVWEASLTELSPAVDELNGLFATNDYAAKWEQALGHPYPHDAFYALICNAMDNGPDCIDVSHDKDVFNMAEDGGLAARRISHEFGIYILMDILPDAEFQGYDYWGLKEGLAEYFNILVCGGYPDWTGGEEYIGFYAQLREDNPHITPRDMFLQAADFYVPVSN